MHRAPYAYPTGHRRHTPLPIPTADRRRLTLGSRSLAPRFAVVAQQDVGYRAVKRVRPLRLSSAIAEDEIQDDEYRRQQQRPKDRQRNVPPHPER